MKKEKHFVCNARLTISTFFFLFFRVFLADLRAIKKRQQQLLTSHHRNINILKSKWTFNSRTHFSHKASSAFVAFNITRWCYRSFLNIRRWACSVSSSSASFIVHSQRCFKKGSIRVTKTSPRSFSHDSRWITARGWIAISRLDATSCSTRRSYWRTSSHQPTTRYSLPCTFSPVNRWHKRWSLFTDEALEFASLLITRWSTRTVPRPLCCTAWECRSRFTTRARCTTRSVSLTCLTMNERRKSSRTIPKDVPVLKRSPFHLTASPSPVRSTGRAKPSLTTKKTSSSHPTKPFANVPQLSSTKCGTRQGHTSYTESAFWNWIIKVFCSFGNNHANKHE